MTPRIFLRIASGLMLFHLIGHSIGNATWKETNEPLKKEVISQMTTNEFVFMGASRTMGDYYTGYGYCVSIALLFFTIILWLISNSLNDNRSLANKIIIPTCILFLAWSLDEFVFFFPFAACTTLLAAISTFIAFLKLQKKTT